MQPLRQSPLSGVGVAPEVSRPIPVVTTQKKTKPRDRARFFYIGAAILLLVVMFVGFQQFYLHGRAFPNRPLTPPIRTLIIAHGVTMSSWVLLLVAQSSLVLSGKRRLHMALGKAGAVLAVCIFIFGFKLAVAAARVAPPSAQLWNLSLKHFMIVPLTTVIIFAGFVTVGVLNRRRPNIHRPMMLLATLAAMPAPLDRIDAVRSLYEHTIWGATFGPYFAALVIGAGFLVVKWALTRKFDRYFAAGWAVLVVLGAAIMSFARTGAWDGIASVLLRY